MLKQKNLIAEEIESEKQLSPKELQHYNKLVEKHKESHYRTPENVKRCLVKNLLLRKPILVNTDVLFELPGQADIQKENEKRQQVEKQGWVYKPDKVSDPIYAFMTFMKPGK